MPTRLPGFSCGLISRLAIMLSCLLPLCSLAQSGGETGFENNSASAWTPGGSTESAATGTTARTGAYSLVFTTTSSSSNKYWYANSIYGSSASGTYVHFIYWALGSDNITSMDASMRYASSAPPSGTGSTANGTAASINNTTWTRLSYAAGNSNGRHYFPAPRRTSGNATSVYVDDLVMYTSSSSTTDLTAPNNPGAISGSVSGTNVSLGWTSNTDAGTGVQATLILRTTNLSAAAPVPNSQAVYSTTGGAAGPDSIGAWKVISTTTAATATSFTDAGVANGSYKYAVLLRDLAYNYSSAAVSATLVVGGAAPAITVTPGSFNGAFGNVVAGSVSAAQSYSVSGTSLSANLSIVAPADFEISTSPTTGFGASLSLPATSGTLSATTIYVRYGPGAATGASGAQTITHASTGATSQTIGVSGNALATEPSSAGTIGFGTIGTTSIVVNLPTVGNGSARIIVVKQGIATTWTPTDGSAQSGVNANFSTATDQGGGNKVVYAGSGSGSGVVTVTGLTAGIAYYFSVFEYNAGTGSSQNYLLTPSASGNASTAGLPAPSIAINSSGFNGAFGNTVSGSSSLAQQYSVSGANIVANLSITAPAGFEVSTSAGGGYAASFSLAPVAGAVAPTPIYVRYSPTSATGATGTLTINHSSTGASAQTLAVSGNALAAEPASAGSITFGARTGTSIVVNLPTVGNGGKRIIVVRPGSTSFSPSDGVVPTGINANYSSAADQGSGNKVVYNGSGSGNGVVTVSGLSGSTSYAFTVFEYNEGTGSSQNYLLSPVAGDTAFTASPSVTITAGSFAGQFGNVVAGTNSAAQSFSVSGINLQGAISLAAPADFQVSLSSGSGYGSTLTITPVAGAVTATTVYARYSPVAATGASGTLNIVAASTAAVSQSIAVSGNALAAEPTSSGTISIGNVTTNSATISLPSIGNGARRFIICRPSANTAIIPADGLAYTGVNADYGLATDQGNANKIIYDGTGSGSNLVTVTGLSSGTNYRLTVYEYNVGTGTSQNYRTSTAATDTVTIRMPTPIISLSTTGFNGVFGNVITGSFSLASGYSISGVNLSDSVIVTAPAGFGISLSAGAGFVQRLALPQSNGTLNPTQIFARFAPVVAAGATGNVFILHSSQGATVQSLAVSGNALAVRPVSIGSIAFGNVTPTSINVHLPTIGNGTRRMIVVNLGSPAGFVPVDANGYGGVNADYSLATTQAGGGRIVYDGPGSGNDVVKVTGLVINTLYYFTVYEYNLGTGSSHCYLVNPAASSNMTTYDPTIPPAGVRHPMATSIRIYPNPASDVLHVDAPVPVSVIVSDLTGRLLLRSEAGVVSLQQLPAGNVVVRIFDAAGSLIRQDLVGIRH